jgi:tetratricopeptide (TPR) repeat protein
LHRDIASSKFKVIAGEDRKIQIKAEVVTAVAKLADRRAKFQLYMKSYEKNMKLQQCIFTSEGKQSPADPNNVRILKSSFNRLHSYSVYWRQVKATMLTRLRSKLKILYSLVFTKWCLRDLKTFGKKESLSAGSIYLNKVMGKREEMQRLLRETIADASSIRQQLEVVTIPRESRNKLLASSGYALMEEGMNHTELGRATGGLHLLYEGDGMTRAAKFDLACSLYEAQIISIRSRSQTCGNVNGRRIIPDGDIKLLAFTHGRLGKLFLLQHKLDRSLVEFDRQLSLALEVGDEAEMADAYLGMGSAYLTKGELDDAIRYLDTSQGKFLVVGNAHRQRLGLKALQECYERKY